MRLFATALIACILLSGCSQQGDEWVPLSSIPNDGAYTVLRGEAALGPQGRPPRGQVSSLSIDGDVSGKKRVQLFSADFLAWASGELAIANDRLPDVVLIKATGETRHIPTTGPTSALKRLEDGSIVRLANIGQRPEGYLTILELYQPDGTLTRKVDLRGYLVGIELVDDSIFVIGSDGGSQGKIIVLDAHTFTPRQERTYPDAQSIVRCGEGDASSTILCAEQRQDGNPSYFTEGYNRYLVKIDTKTLTKTLVARSNFEITDIFAYKGKVTLLTTEGLALIQDGRIDVRLRIGSAENQATAIVRHGSVADVTVEHVGTPAAKPQGFSKADVVRINLDNLRELRRTRASFDDGDEEYWRLVFIPQEFFQGVEVIG